MGFLKSATSSIETALVLIVVISLIVFGIAFILFGAWLGAFLVSLAIGFVPYALIIGGIVIIYYLGWNSGNGNPMYIWVGFIMMMAGFIIAMVMGWF